MSCTRTPPPPLKRKVDLTMLRKGAPQSTDSDGVAFVPQKGKWRGNNKSAKRTSSAISPDLRSIKSMCLSGDIACNPNVGATSIVSTATNVTVVSTVSSVYSVVLMDTFFLIHLFVLIHLMRAQCKLSLHLQLMILARQLVFSHLHRQLITAPNL